MTDDRVRVVVDCQRTIIITPAGRALGHRSHLFLLSLSLPARITGYNLSVGVVHYFLVILRTGCTIMGIVFGSTGAKEPAFQVLAKYSGYEVRQYPQIFIAEVKSSGNGDDFRTLAKYIGVFGKPENVAAQPMAMTAPVLMDPDEGQTLAMTAPVINTAKTMSFVLPFEFKDLQEIPKPSNEAVTIRACPERVVAVEVFSGWYTDDIGQQHLGGLCEKLRRDGLLSDATEPNWSVAQYHPPFTIPFLRRNEVWVDVKKEAVKQQVAE